MRRREFITLLGGAAASTAHPSYIRAQQPEQVRRIGLLMGWAESDPAVKSYVAAFRGALAKLGWTDDTKLRIELRWSAGDPALRPNFGSPEAGVFRLFHDGGLAAPTRLSNIIGVFWPIAPCGRSSL
jgi:putative ABC transport system substrate-binding protein